MDRSLNITIFGHYTRKIRCISGPRFLLPVGHNGAHSLPPINGTMQRNGGGDEFTPRPGAFFLSAPKAGHGICARPDRTAGFPFDQKPPDIFRRYCRSWTTARWPGRWRVDQRQTRPFPGAVTAWRIGRCGAAPWRQWPTADPVDCRSADAVRRTACRCVWRPLPRKRWRGVREWPPASACRDTAG